MDISFAQKMAQLQDLSRDGPLRIRESGKMLKNFIWQLKDQKPYVSLAAQGIIDELVQKFRALIIEHKEYILFHQSIRNHPLDEQLQSLSEKFTQLEYSTTNLTEKVHNFIDNHNFEIQDGYIVRLDVENEVEDEILSSSKSQISEIEVVEKSLTNLTTENLQSKNIICQIGVPLHQIGIPIKFNKAFSFENMSVTLEPELQVQYLKTPNGHNQFFVGIQCDMSVNLSNLKFILQKKSNFFRIRHFNTVYKIDHSRIGNNSQLTLSIGKIFHSENKELSFFTTLPLKKLQKNDISFQVEYKHNPMILSSKQNGYVIFKPTFSFELFPCLDYEAILVQGSKQGLKKVCIAYQSENSCSPFTLGSITDTQKNSIQKLVRYGADQKLAAQLLQDDCIKSQTTAETKTSNIGVSSESFIINTYQQNHYISRFSIGIVGIFFISWCFSCKTRFLRIFQFLTK